MNQRRCEEFYSKTILEKRQMNEDLLRISDGKIYSLNDMVKVGCHDCNGCSSCCEGMGDSILLDPYDVFMLSTNLGGTFEELLKGPVELHSEQGLILPNLKMAGEGEQCSFLDDAGRCSIHSFRPGICRLFPLGRNYEGDSLQYFLLKDACPAPNKTKMKVEKWIADGNVKKYHQFLIDWHKMTKQFRAELATYEEQQAKQLTMVFLNLFYMKAYESGDFFTEFYERAAKLGM